MKLTTVIAVIACLSLSIVALRGDPPASDVPKNHEGPLPPLNQEQQQLADRLRTDVELLATTIGERNPRSPESYARAADEIEKRLAGSGYTVTRQVFTVEGVPCVNVIAQRLGAKRPDEIVVIGAHYDSVTGTVGANDNATGVAALLAIAQAMKDDKPDRTLRFVAFANEEPPYFQTAQMGSLIYAHRCRELNEKIVAMVSFDGLGFYSDEPESQHYPEPLSRLYPHTANFVAFVGNVASTDLTARCLKSFRASAAFPAQGGVAPDGIPGVGWSDHWSFWQAGYPAIMVTDTLPFRYEHYHTTDDTPDKIDYERVARVVDGMTGVVRMLVAEE